MVDSPSRRVGKRPTRLADMLVLGIKPNLMSSKDLFPSRVRKSFRWYLPWCVELGQLRRGKLLSNPFDFVVVFLWPRYSTGNGRVAVRAEVRRIGR